MRAQNEHHFVLLLPLLSLHVSIKIDIVHKVSMIHFEFYRSTFFNAS